MNSYYGLSELEYNLMKIFWNSNQPLSFAQISKQSIDIIQRKLAPTTLHTHLTRLIEKGVLLSGRSGYKRSYYAAITECELSQRWAQKFIDESFKGSVKNLVFSLTYKTPISEAEKKELFSLLEQIDIQRRNS